ncbi:hypothetical protein SARC_12158 [Sphaeroforma arctica JP610]|uniref:RNB domain-containing protein n=1 Tax=Sphaeroforma arctica JP610 TaxID=667725 RepID=A0A0L0FEW0_9EUKA|nr:hypothetical protein SARC_12158 [Sphaeroforma arctica JP610]KNC75314.1 hypothetical protein SARC_12158 [Sphaeroforma arctica JP610]|eukprot:XP_014149216.1 hypothetical protein SARC_12158 [Sphaeroforma arctica JP610]
MDELTNDVASLQIAPNGITNSASSTTDQVNRILLPTLGSSDSKKKDKKHTRKKHPGSQRHGEDEGEIDECFAAQASEGSRSLKGKAPNKARNKHRNSKENPSNKSRSHGDVHNTPKSPSAKRKNGDNRQPHKGNNNSNRGSNSHRVNNSQKHALHFETYITEQEGVRKLKAGEVFVGKLRINQKNYREAYVPVAALDGDVLLPSQHHRNRALHGDEVMIELLPRDEWRPLKADFANAMILTETEERQLTDDAKEYPSEFLRKTGRVLRIEREVHNRIVIGVFMPLNGPRVDQGHFGFRPLDTKVPRLMIPVDTAPTDLINADSKELTEKYKTQLFSAKIREWHKKSMMAIGELGENLGENGDVDAETKALLVQYAVETAPFSDEAIACLPPTPWSIPAEEYETRTDLRHERVFTIDPATAMDLDDALSIKRSDDGGFIVGVHIADVTFFVKADTALDAEAERRATTVYLVQRNYPMLPRLLCEQLCSLNPGVERLAFSVFWRMDVHGKVLDTWFARSIIKSCIKMSYEDAQLCISKDAAGNTFEGIAAEIPEVSGDHTAMECAEDVILLNNLALQMRKRRFNNGSLKLDNVKLMFRLDESGLPEDFRTYEQKDSNRLVEEFMLLANCSVARQLHDKLPSHAFLRRQLGPDEKQISKAVAALAACGVVIEGRSSAKIHESLMRMAKEEIRKKETKQVTYDLNNEAAKKTVVQFLTKPMKLAEYICEGAAVKKAYAVELQKAVILDKNTPQEDKPVYDFDEMTVDEIKELLENRGEKMHHNEVVMNTTRHYALAMPLYTHFTSPIRRYADVVVHRMLWSTLIQSSEKLRSPAVLANIAKHCNEQKQASKSAQEQSDKIFLCSLLRVRGGMRKEAVVVGVLDAAFDVYIPDFGIEQRVHFDKLDGLREDLVNFSKQSKVLELHWGPNVPAIHFIGMTEDTGVQTIHMFSRIYVLVESDNTIVPVTLKVTPVRYKDESSIANPSLEL